MVKAKELLGFVCNDLNYKFFVGTSVAGISDLYTAMDPEFMHFIPATNAQVAFDLGSGASFAGLNVVILLTNRELGEIKLRYEGLPMLILTVGTDFSCGGFLKASFSTLKRLKGFVGKISKQKKPGILCFKGGQIDE